MLDFAYWIFLSQRYIYLALGLGTTSLCMMWRHGWLNIGHWQNMFRQNIRDQMRILVPEADIWIAGFGTKALTCLT